MGRTHGRARRWPWLLATLVLLAGGAALMSGGERMPHEPEVQVYLPREMSAADYQRLTERRRPPILAAPSEPEPAAPPTPPPAPRDPLLVALPPRVERLAVVVEANALRHSPVGELLLSCFLGGPDHDELAKLRAKTGFDVLEDLDRVAVADRTFLLTGRFGQANWDELFPKSEQMPSAVADARRWQSDSGETMLLWKNELLVLGRNADEIDAVTARLTGRAPAEAPVISEQDSYGEIYGVVSSAAMASLFEHQSADVATKLKTITEQVKLHVDATHDVGIVADAQGNDATGALDLAKTLGGALALGRAAARAQGKDDLAAFLDYASVHPGAAGAFRVELALPLAYLEAQLKDCPGRRAREQAQGSP